VLLWDGAGGSWRESCAVVALKYVLLEGGLELEMKSSGTSVNNKSQGFFYHCLRNLCRVKVFHMIFCFVLVGRNLKY